MILNYFFLFCDFFLFSRKKINVFFHDQIVKCQKKKVLFSCCDFILLSLEREEKKCTSLRHMMNK